MPAITLLTIPNGSQFVETISGDEPDDLNDFQVRIVLDGNGTGLTESGITLSSGSSLVSLRGENSVWGGDGASSDDCGDGDLYGGCGCV